MRAQKLQAGECDIMPYPNPADIAGLKADANLTVMEQAGLNIGYMAYNTTQPPFDKAEVRKALNMAIDKRGAHQGAVPGRRRHAGRQPDPADDVVVQQGRRRTTPTIRKRPRRCWPMPASPTIDSSGHRPRSRPYNPNFQRVAELIQADWAKVGVKAKIVTYEWTEVSRATARRRTAPAPSRSAGPATMAIRTTSSPPCSPARPIGVSNYSSWCNKDFEDLIQKAKTTTDQAERTKLYEAGAGDLQASEAPAFLLAHSPGLHADDRKKVIGFMMDPLGIHRFDGVDIAE